MSVSRRHFLGGSAAMAGLAFAMPSHVLSQKSLPKWHIGYQTIDPAGFDPAPMRKIFGNIPKGLDGTFYRNGPGQFHYGDKTLEHWFDGDGMIQRIRINENGAIHHGRFVQTEKRKAEQAAGALLAPGFGTVGSVDYPVSGPNSVNAANTSILPINGELMALWEAGSPWSIDPVTLETLGPKAWRNDLKGMPFLAHPKVEPNGRVWNLAPGGEHIGIYNIDADGTLADFGMVKADIPVFIHDWAMTKRHLVLLLQPWVYTHKRPPSVAGLEWKPQLGMKILIVDKDDLTSQRWSQADARAFYHTGGAWEDNDGTIHLDAAFYNSPAFGVDGGADLIRGVYDPAEKATTNLSKLIIPMSGDAKIIETGINGEFPQINRSRVGQRHQLTACVSGKTKAHPNSTTLTVQNWDSGKADSFYFGEDRIIEEHLFVRKPGAEKETDSWLIGSVLNVEAQKSEICVFEAGAVKDGPLVIWQADYAWPLGFHGAWVG